MWRNPKLKPLSNNPEISAAELQNRINNGEEVQVLDVREPIEYHTHNIGGINIALSKLEVNFRQLSWNKTDEIIVICQAGLRSQTAQLILQQNGYQNVRNLTGGLLALRRVKN
ncbi:rhodanese-like domain-containing protein [Mucilaginibacter terrae]|uniref:rhodanese-like domain-containing protein n=1 Tax=Mucilaginibacter terrae TaxID=1955052 RepID=UPI003638C524